MDLQAFTIPVLMALIGVIGYFFKQLHEDHRGYKSALNKLLETVMEVRADLKNHISLIKKDIDSVKAEIDYLKSAHRNTRAEARAEIKDHDKRIDELEKKILILEKNVEAKQ